MSTEDLKTLINLYFDNELEKSKEPVLFSMLSQDSEAREYFKKLNVLKSGIENTMEVFPSTLNAKILHSIGKLNETQTVLFINKNIFSAITYSLTIILLILTVFFYVQSEEYKVRLFDLTREVKKQSDRLELIMNAMPQVEVTGGYVRTKQIVVRPNM